MLNCGFSGYGFKSYYLPLLNFLKKKLLLNNYSILLKVGLTKIYKISNVDKFRILHFYNILGITDSLYYKKTYNHFKYSLILTFNRKQFFLNIINTVANNCIFSISFLQTLRLLKISSIKNSFSNLTKFFSFLRKKMSFFKIDIFYYIILKINVKKYSTKNLINEITKNIKFNYILYKNTFSFSKSTLKKKRRIKKRLKKRLIKEI